MRKMLKFSVLLLVLGLILGLIGCPNNGDDDENNKNNGGNNNGGTNGGTTVSFQSFSPPSIYVDNKSGERLVAFKGSLNPNYLISGIPAYATNHGLAKTSSVNNTLFTTTGDFALILITEAQYNQNKNNLAAAAVFAEIYACYNHEATNNNRFQISSKSGGSGRITLNNPTSWNIEIRKDGPTGEVMGYVASQMTNTVLRVNAPDDYSLYPVFKRYVPSDKEIYEVVPKYTSGALTGKPYAKDFALSTADGTSSWNLSEVAEKVNFTLSSGSFYLRIVNNSNTAVRFTRGDDEQLTSMGIRGVAPANTNVYSVKIARNPDGTYPATQEISQLKIGTLQNPVAVPSNTYKLDYVYTITVTGADASNLALGTMTESENPLDIEAMFGY
jgi:hypothetical protein